MSDKMTIKRDVLIVVILTLLDHPVPEVFGRPSKLTRLVYYNQNATWDEANEACSRLGGYLVHIEHENKHGVVMETIQQLGSRNLNHIWLGQIRQTTDDAHFVWTNSCTAVSWTKWAMSEPSGEPTDQCVRLDVINQVWEAVQCILPAKICCQLDTNEPCLYQAHAEKTLDSSSANIVYDTHTTIGNFTDECKQLCDAHEVSGNVECWAAGFTEGSGQYNLYSSLNRLTVQNMSLMINSPGSTLWLKICHKGEETAVHSLISAAGQNWNEYECETNSFWLRTTEDCECPCQNLSDKEREKFIQDILLSLTLNTSNLSSVRRKYYSVVENDVVTLGLGYTGVIFIVVSALVVVLSDVDILIRGRSGVFKQLEES